MSDLLIVLLGKKSCFVVNTFFILYEKKIICIDQFMLKIIKEIKVSKFSLQSYPNQNPEENGAHTIKKMKKKKLMMENNVWIRRLKLYFSN